jgi:hypothetical protein
MVLSLTLTLKTAVQNRRENRDRMKIEEKTIVRQISAVKASCLKGLNLIAHGSFFNRMVPKCFTPDNKFSG